MLSVRQLYEILRCRAEVFVVEQGIAYQDLDEADYHSKHCFIKGENGRIKGYLRIIINVSESDKVKIGRMLIMPEYRRKGYAKTLLLSAITHSFKTAEMIEIDAQTYLKEFYSTFGFEQVSNEFIYESRPHIRMVLNKSAFLRIYPSMQDLFRG